MEEMNYLFNIEYIGTNIVSFLIFYIYIYDSTTFFKRNIRI